MRAAVRCSCALPDAICGRVAKKTAVRPSADDAIVDALHAHGFQIAIESNGTIAVHPGIDWVCISPKAGSDVIQHQGDELKLVWPQLASDLDRMEGWQFAHFLIQPMDKGHAELNAASVEEATRFVMDRPKWRLSLQNHKILGLP
jgi:organic radical activating enzyme